MTYRKNWFDYVLWAVYAGLCVMLLAFTGYHIYVSYVGKPLARLGAFLVFPVLICLYLACRLVGQEVHKKHSLSDHGAAMLEALVVSVSFVFGLIVRISRVLYAVHQAVAGEFYERALVRAGQETAPLAHGMSELYVRCLRVVFSFLGNGPASAMLFQVLLQVASMALGYCLVRRAAGRLPACVSLLFLAFSGVYLEKISVIDPECLYLALYLLGLYLTFFLIKSQLRGGSGAGRFIGAVCLGILLGGMVYLEVWSATVFLFLAGLFTGKCQASGTRKSCMAVFFVTLLSGAAGFLGAVALDSALFGNSFVRCLSGWISLYGQIGFQGRLFGMVRGNCLQWVILFLGAAFLVFEFIRGEREQDYTLWFLPCILVTLLLLFGYGVAGCESIAMFLWSVLAGLGLKNCLFGGQAEAVRARIEEINEAAREHVALKEEKPRFIENPLPLPKKHVKREMDYDYTVAEADMHYQVEIAEGDDFDH